MTLCNFPKCFGQGALSPFNKTGGGMLAYLPHTHPFQIFSDCPHHTLSLLNFRTGEWVGTSTKKIIAGALMTLFNICN